MTEKRYLLVKCIQNQWGIVDKTLENVNQLILMHHNKLILNEIVNELNEKEQLNEENKQLKIKNDLLSDELEQAKAVIHKKWDEYLKKKME